MDQGFVKVTYGEYGEGFIYFYDTVNSNGAALNAEAYSDISQVIGAVATSVEGSTNSTGPYALYDPNTLVEATWGPKVLVPAFKPGSSWTCTPGFDGEVSWTGNGSCTTSVPVTLTRVDQSCAKLPDTFGAPMVAIGLRQTRQHLQQTLAPLQARIASLPIGQSALYGSTGNTQRRDGGLHTTRTELSLGGDHRHNAQWVSGAAIGLGNPRMRWSDGSRLEGSSAVLTGYGSWSPTEPSYVAAALSFETTHYLLRTTDGQGLTQRDFTTGTNLGLSVSAGHELPLGSASLSPYVRVDEIRSRIGNFGYGGPINKGRSGAVSVGSQVQNSFSTRMGVISPHARIEFTQITGWRLQGNSANAYAEGQSALPTNNPLVVDRQFGQLGLGVSAVLQRGLTLFSDYTSGFGEKNVRDWRIALGVRGEL